MTTLYLENLWRCLSRPSAIFGRVQYEYKPRTGKMNCKTTQIDRMMRMTWCEIMRDSSIRLVVGRAGIRRKSGATNFFPNKRAEHSGLKTATSNQHLSSVYLSPVRRPTSFHTAFLSGPRKRFRTCFIYFICVWTQGGAGWLFFGNNET